MGLNFMIQDVLSARRNVQGIVFFFVLKRSQKEMDASDTTEDRPEPRWLRLSTSEHCQSFAERQHEVVCVLLNLSIM